MERGSSGALVRVGRIGRAHGVRGEVALEGASLTEAELGAIGTFTWRGPRGDTRPLTLATVRPASARMLLGFAGIDDRDRAGTLAGGELFAEAGRLPDPGPDRAYAFELVGLAVRDETGRPLGTIAEILTTGAHPVYVVRGEREILIPAVPEVVKAVDLAGGVVSVALPPGLEDL